MSGKRDIGLMQIRCRRRTFTAVQPGGIGIWGIDITDRVECKHLMFFIQSAVTT